MCRRCEGLQSGSERTARAREDTALRTGEQEIIKAEDDHPRSLEESREALVQAVNGAETA